MMGRAGRVALIAGILGGAVLLTAAAFVIGPYRDRYVYAPQERAAEDAVHQVRERQVELHKSTGRFVPFAAGEVESNTTLLGLPWSTFPTASFHFDAEPLPSGNLRLRALPRADRVGSLEIRPRSYVTELTPAGEILRAGWIPEGA
jgi:hypothetical protein